MPAVSSYNSGGDVSVLSSRMMTTTRRSSSVTPGTSSYTYRTIDRPSYLGSVGATSSYLTSRPPRFSSSILSDLKPSYSSGTYKSRFSTMASSPSSSNYSSSYSSRQTSEASDTRDSSSYRSSRLSDSSSSSYTSRRLDGGTTVDTTSTVRSRYQRPSTLDSKDSTSSTTTSSRYENLFNNDTASRLSKSSYNDRPTAIRSRLNQSTEECVDLKRPSVAEMRRIFDPSLTCKDSTNEVKKDSDDESSSSEESSDQEAVSEVTSSRRTRQIEHNKENKHPESAPCNVKMIQLQQQLETSSIESNSPTLRSKHGLEKGGLVGLRNIGNTCFMNSVLQCLSNTRPLLEYVLKDGYTSDINATTSSMKGALIKAFATLLQELWRGESDERVVNTSAFKSQVQRFAPRFGGYAQQDAQEFLRYLLEGLHEDVNRVSVRPKPILTEIDDSLSDSQKAMEAWKRYLRRDDSKIVDIFVGQLRSTLRCTVCGHCSVTFDPFWDLSLPIPSGTSQHGQVKLSHCFDLFTKEEVLDGDEKPTCSRCQARQKCTKSFSIHKFPRILVLHLKRFSPTERFRGKLSCTVDFPLTGFDLNAYASAGGGRGGSGVVGGSTYNLYGVAYHSGTTYSGHYIASCKHPYSGSWHEYNDSRVSSLPVRSVVNSEAYVLFYEISSSSTSHL